LSYFLCRDHILDETKRFKVADYSYSYDRERDQHKEPHKKADNKDKEKEKEKEVCLEKRLSHAIAAGYFMNAAMQCSNDSVYKCLSLPMINKDSNKPTSHDLRLVYISPQSSFAVITPSEYVIYQELVFNNKLFMRNVSYVSKKRLFSFINEWKPVSPLQLNGIVVSTTTGTSNSTVNIKRERESGGKDDSTNKKMKSEEKEESESLSFPAPTTTTVTTVSAENSGNRQKEIEQAKLRYLMRKKT
jgi:hypothetical protein